ncbi:hypothetical protein [Natrarchaeobius oligotrophus]|uniref:Uncharacterized protein n=1 Tax=Natrarchaeobius chitinivorans TaxID=1679083 RepID=A0A3N6MAU7_NATCH|nr:hypothetical protein [Natrarchaeobius chitinivorans]RQH00909.1 hypothetical protein EA472_09815 [Natrarchaeobius chitinivorans]
MKPIYFCRRCDEELPRTAEECPHCGYNPASIAWRFGAGALIFGGGLALVSPPIGLFGIFVGIVAIGGSYLLSPAG